MDINSLLEICAKQNASDLHISPNTRPILRIDGELQEIKDSPILSPEVTKEIIYSILSEQQRQTFEKHLELDFSVDLHKIAGFRGNAYTCHEGIAAAFRIIPKKIPTLEEVHAPNSFKELLHLSSGLILITGPTGSGKSTTLAAMVDYINTNRTDHIITLEDPIEFVHQNKKSLINQRQILRDTLSFSASLRAALREDPDVILVGELRDLETIRLALIAAETGHLILATLHTSSAPQAINRIIDVFPSGEKNIIRNIVSHSLQGIIYQTLLQKKGGGRIPAYEILFAIPAIRNLIRKDQISQMYSVMQTNQGLGMHLMDTAIKELIEKGLVDVDVARKSGYMREIETDQRWVDLSDKKLKEEL